MSLVLLLCADLKKNFDREPMNTLAEAGSSVQLQCLPPQGVPTPEVSFIRILNSIFILRFYLNFSIMSLVVCL